MVSQMIRRPSAGNCRDAVALGSTDVFSRSAKAVMPEKDFTLTPYSGQVMKDSEQNREDGSYGWT